MRALKLVLRAVRRSRPVRDLVARLLVPIQSKPVPTEAAVAFRDRETKITAAGSDTRVSDQVRLLGLVKNFEREKLRVLLLDQERLVGLQVELHDVALFKFGPEDEIVVIAESVGPINHSRIGLAAQVDQPVQASLNVDTLNGLEI